MTLNRPVRRFAVVLGTLASLAAGSLGAVPADHAGAAVAPRAAAQAHTTTLTFAVPGCDGCRIQLHQGRETDDPSQPEIWHSREKEVREGEVTFTVRSKRTWGMSTTVVAPWEGQTGYLTTVAYRYQGKSVGDAVTFRQARHRRNASACWAGTRSDEVRIPLTVRKVMVDGVHERVPGSIAFTPTTEDWMEPMRRAWRGVLGSQDVNICDRP